jgi:putative Mg2+ transporter-C (MgtC) family protein
MFDWVQHDVMKQLAAFVQVVIAAALGAVVGIERELAHRPAGLRTHALMAATSALLVVLTDALVYGVPADSLGGVVQADPIRMVQAIVIGVSFLGAGTIFRARDNSIVGLTTGASLLLVAGIGIAVGVGLLYLAVLVTTFALLVLRALDRFEPSVRDKSGR